MDRNSQTRAKNVCLFFYKSGICADDINCKFIHEKLEIDSDGEFATRTFPTLFKTNLCESYESKTTCYYDTICTFAHGVQEVRSGPYDPSISRKKACRYFINDLSCTYGKKCNFSHILPARKRVCHQLVETKNCKSGEKCKYSHSLPPGNVCARFYNGQCARGHTCRFKHESRIPTRIYPTFFKTKKCHQWEASRECRYAENCYNAHGDTELEPILSPTRYQLDAPREDTSASASASTSNTGNQIFSDRVARGPRLYSLDAPRADTSTSASVSTSNTGNQIFAHRVARGPRLLPIANNRRRILPL